MRVARGVVAICILGLSSPVLPQVPESISTRTAQWLVMNPPEKTAYLEGLCEGLKESTVDKAGDLFCESPALNGKTKFRFCGKVFNQNAKPAIQYLDEFYSHGEHSDIPHRVAVVHHNDQTCQERTLKKSIASIQAQNRCIRQLANMHLSGVSISVLKIQQQECERYK